MPAHFGLGGEPIIRYGLKLVMIFLREGWRGATCPPVDELGGERFGRWGIARASTLHGCEDGLWRIRSAP
jgi:hypothetical protein